MKMFNLINIEEKAGSSVPNIFNVWEDEGVIELSIEEKFNLDRTVLFQRLGELLHQLKAIHLHCKSIAP